MAKRLLILEDGTIFEGQAFGADVRSEEHTSELHHLKLSRMPSSA